MLILVLGQKTLSLVRVRVGNNFTKSCVLLGL